MNKYQEALDWLSEEIRNIKKNEAKRYINIIRELVDKATLKKLDSIYYLVHKKYNEYYVTGHCFVCGNKFNISKENKPNYCPNCGQCIDWSEYE